MSEIIKVTSALNSYQATSGLASSQRLINIYLEENPPSSPFPYTLYGTAGHTTWKDFGTFNPIYGFEKMGNNLFVVAGLSVYKLDNNGDQTSIGTLAGTPGRVMMCNNGTQVTIRTENGDLYYCTTTASSLAKITDGDLQPSSSVTNLDDYTISSIASSNGFQISTYQDTTAYDPLEVEFAQRNSEDIVRSIAKDTELWHFKETSAEVFYNSGNPDFPFARITQAVIKRGCAAKYSIAINKGSFIFLANDNIIYQTKGYDIQPISTFAVSKAIEKYSRKSDAYGFVYTLNGHTFYTITFPRANKTWEFDFNTGLWHERQSGNGNKWLANCYVDFAGKHLIGDSNTGKIYQLDPDIYSENGEEIIKTLVSVTQFASYKNVAVNKLIAVMDMGVGADGSGQGSDPKIMAKWSFDGGKTFDNELWQPMGDIGEYEKVLVWTQIGGGKSLIFQLSISDPIKFALSEMYLDVEIGREF